VAVTVIVVGVFFNCFWYCGFFFSSWFLVFGVGLFFFLFLHFFCFAPFFFIFFFLFDRAIFSPFFTFVL